MTRTAWLMWLGYCALVVGVASLVSIMLGHGTDPPAPADGSQD